MDSLNIILLITTAAIIILVLVFILIYKKRLEYKSGILFKNQIERHFNEVKNIYTTMRGWRHDFHNHIQTMKGHIALNQNEQLDKYLSDLDADLRHVDTQIKTGNTMVDAILNSKVSLAESQNISMNVKAQVDEKINVSDIDLCVIIGNLMDNAIDACILIENVNSRFIRIYIGKLKQQLYISITNSTKQSKREDQMIYISKKGGLMHGHGLKRVDVTVKKYAGYINRQNEAQVFATEILLPL